METPSFSRRGTRFRAMAATDKISISTKDGETEQVLSRSKQRKSDRSVLFDITNDSPIIGLAKGSSFDGITSSAAKNYGRFQQTPGSGETLLRNEVRALIQNVEEETKFTPTIFNRRRSALSLNLSLNPSPTAILAPTPNNTPILLNPLYHGDIANDSGFKGFRNENSIAEGSGSEFAQASIHSLKQEATVPWVDLVKRELQFDDSPAKVVSHADEEKSNRPAEDGEKFSSSLPWWLTVNAGPGKGKGGESGEEEAEEGEEVDGLCDGLRTLSAVEGGLEGMPEFRGRHKRFVHNEQDEIEGEEEVEPDFLLSPTIQWLVGMPEFRGRHKRFVHNEQDEIEGEEEVEPDFSLSPTIQWLVGRMPLPEGKHLRFHEEDDED